MAKRRTIEEQIAEQERKKGHAILRIRARDKLHHARIAAGKPKGTVVAFQLVLAALHDLAEIAGIDDLSVVATMPAPKQGFIEEIQGEAKDEPLDA